MIEVAESMQVMQVPGDRCVLTVDLKGVQRLVASCVTGGLERSQGSILEATHEGTGIINAHLLDFASERMNAFLDERFRHGTHILNTAVEPEGGINTVSQQIAGDTAAGCIDIESPERFTTLRQFGPFGPASEYRHIADQSTFAKSWTVQLLTE